VVTDADFAKLDRLKAQVQAKLAQVAEDEADTALEFAVAQQKLSLALEKMRTLRNRRLRLRREAGLLSDREKSMFAKELASIEEVERLEREQEKGRSDVSGSLGSSEPPLSAADSELLDFVSSDFLSEGLPPDWSFSQLLGSPNTA